LTTHLGDVPKGVPDKTDSWFKWGFPVTPPIWKDGARVAAVSEFTRNLALRHYPVKIEVIPNGVDLNHLDPGKIRANNPPQIIFAGRFTRQKNLLTLVNTLATLKHLKWDCTLLGDGPLRDSILQEIQNASLEERITLAGWVTPEEVIEQLSKSDILFMPSYSEGLPVVGVQSLAMGLSIIASRVVGLIDLIDDGINGYLVEMGDLDGYVRSLEKLITDPTRLQAFRLASRQKAHSFEIENITERYENLFLSILS